jgi:DNA-binding transcriptional LysR family regulator
MMRPTFDMDALRTIVVGTELGSFARAASHLGRSQSAVSMQLRKLEQQAGQLLFRRNGRGLVPTEAGDALLAYARRIIALNDEAAASVGTTITAASVRMGLPQDLFEDVMPEVITRFSRQRPSVHVEVRAGRNYALEEEVRAGRLDVAVAFFPAGSDTHGTRLVCLPMLWLGGKGLAKPSADDPIPLVVFDHPCLFRQAALQTLEGKGRRWRLSLTTPSLPGVWGALRSGYGISVRPAHPIPAGIRDVGPEFGLAKLPPIEMRMLTASELSPAASDLRDILDHVVRKRRVARKKASRHGTRREGA